MSQGVRVIGPDRAQLRWEMVDLDSQLPDDHRARVVWGFVEGLDLSEFYDRIKARDAVAGRPATDPQVVLAVWLYATLEGIGSARAIDRLCQQHAAYRWLCGGAPINHDLLADISAGECGLVGSLADPERNRADRRKADQPGGTGNRRDQGARLRRSGLDEQSQAAGEDREGGGGTRRGIEERTRPRSRRARTAAQEASVASG